MIDPKTGERRPARTYEVRLDPGSRDRPKSFEAARQMPTRRQIHREADDIVERMIRRGVIAPRGLVDPDHDDDDVGGELLEREDAPDDVIVCRGRR